MKLETATTPADPSKPTQAAKRRELVVFCTLAVLIWPFLAVAVVGGYGFVVWMSQLVFGPPGPPH
ncbi:periplasmic nitrate reductase, NapE protein [Hansschlegelia zhihuaiae]|uniref:Periplasmic nitrate reductase, NapE protein n=1 Tax=Hansschlegelia zhihuaiae TaxID=405005 RepID=A0A4Q0MDA1_9HYPH|nr:periplasmic nitrate reductase, NapE protein [Hansschlegelia zhihuaiae]RXF70899.1 periplasmic nitrate reductase, NapE protein [Hansschlegelia zhihuaiae]